MEEIHGPVDIKHLKVWKRCEHWKCKAGRQVWERCDVGDISIADTGEYSPYWWRMGKEWGMGKSLWQLESNLWSSGRCSHQSVMLFVAENKEHSSIATPTWRRTTIRKLWWILGLGNILVLYGHPDLILYIHLVFLVSFNCDMAVLLCFPGFYGLHYNKMM